VISELEGEQLYNARARVKTALVTGGAAGIGFETARLLLESGLSVIALDREFSASRIRKISNRRYDLTDLAGIPKLVASLGDITCPEQRRHQNGGPSTAITDEMRSGSCA